MYLSRACLAESALADSPIWSLTRDEYGYHQLVWSLFGDEAERHRDFLYRLDRAGGRAVFLLLSERPPEDRAGLFELEIKDFQPRLAQGELLRFLLRANPVVTRDGRRHDVVMDAKRRQGWQAASRTERTAEAELVAQAGAEWLAARAERAGFALVPERLAVKNYHVHQLSKRGQKVTLATCDFEGVLRVADPQAFLTALAQGFGPAKGFGCGLMLLARAS